MATGAETATADPAVPTMRVWNPLVRMFHWSLAASFAFAWLAGDEAMSLHEWAGYVALALVVFRLLMGIAGPRRARFRDFVRGPAETLAYARDVLAGRERRYIGHNPLGSLMVLALLSIVALLAITGWMQTTDAYWGVRWVKEMHESLADVALVLVGLHVAGVALASWHHRENLVRAMITGRKRRPGPEDIA